MRGRIEIAVAFIVSGIGLVSATIALFGENIPSWWWWPMGSGIALFAIGLLVLLPGRKWKRYGEILAQKFLLVTYGILAYREWKTPKRLIEIKALEFLVNDSEIILKIRARNCLSYRITINSIEGFLCAEPSNKNLVYRWRPGQQGVLPGTFTQPLGGEWDLYLVAQQPSELLAIFSASQNATTIVKGRLDLNTDKLGFFQFDMLSRDVTITHI